jgi:hypothetical protein
VSVALRRGEITATSVSLTLGPAVVDWLAAAEAGTVRTRGRRPFAPSTVRAVRQAWQRRLKRPDEPDEPFESLDGRYGRRRVDRLPLV